MLQGLLRRAYALVWSLALLLLVLLALYVSLGRQYIGLVSRYQTEIFNELEAALGIELQAEALTGSWSGLSPVLRLESLDIGGGAIKLDRAKVVLDPIGSLLGVGPRLKQLRVGHIELDLLQDKAGRWSIPGMSGGSGGTNLDTLLDVVLAVRRASMQSLDVSLTFADGSKTSVRSRDFSWSSDGHFRRSYASLSADQTGEIRLIAEAYGDPRDRDFRASAFVSLDDSRFSALAPLFRNQQIIHNPVDGRLWLAWQAGRRMVAKGVIRADTLAAGALWGSTEQFHDVSMEFVGHHRGDFWQIGFSDFSAKWRDQQLDLAGLSLTHQGDVSWTFSLPALDLAASTALLSDSGVLKRDLQDTLDTLQPSGQLKNLHLNIKRSETSSFSLRSELSNVALAPWQGAPGAEGVNGYLELDENSGTAVIDTDALSLAFPNLYPQAFTLDNMRGEVHWQLNNDRLVLRSSPLQARDADAPLTALLRLDLPLSKEASEPPLMTLAIAAQRLPLASAKAYVPDVLDAGLRRWLDQSIRAGRASTAEFIYRGSLRSGDHDGRTVQLKLDTRALALAFHDEWPEVAAERAQVYLDDGQVWATAYAGNFVGMQLPRVDVRLDDHGGPVLTVNTAASVRATAVQNLFKRSPLGAMTGGVLDDWRMEGVVDSSFSLTMPLVGEPQPEVAVQADLALSELTLPDVNLSLNNVRGPLQYRSDSGLNSSGLRASVLGESIQGRIEQRGDVVHVKASGKMDMAAVRAWLQQPALGFLQGRTDVSVHVQAGGKRPGIEVESAMRGVEVRLPQPLYKGADESRPLKIYQSFAGSGAPLSVELAESFRLQYRQRDGAISVTLGDGNRAPLREGALSIGGGLAFAAMDQWQLALDNYLEWQSLQPVATAGGEVPVFVDRLQVDELEVLGRILHSANISARSEAGDWTLRIDSDEVAGNIALPSQLGDPYVLMLERLALPSLGSSGSAAEHLGDVDPRSFPALDVDIESLSIGGKNYGRVGFDLRTDLFGAHFSALRGQVLGIDLGDASRQNALHWWYQENGRRGSQIKGKFAVRDMGKVLSSLGYERSLETRSGGFDVNVSWPGSPDQWAMSASQGRVKFALKNGRFLKTSDAASGALRVLGIFNMTNIVRRLKFDFRDVFRKGVHFDDMRGELGFGQQQLVLTQPLEVSGPSSRFQMSGNIDLVSEALDMRLVATLPVGSNLPWVAALVGGLPAAAGAYVVTKVFEEQVDSFSSAVYDIRGTVQQPELSFKKIFDVSPTELKGQEMPSQVAP
ncbi:YhdP family protein [Spongiibacter marinus]|uniref:YhdP family protein n=1 Tax=Spongiibacter marinus TaxID=354246 RepID=UPI000409B5AF|nr:YhdP family protein [Spongiibacter marinus]